METFFLQPELFDTYIAISPSLWWNDHGLVRQAEQRLLERPDLVVELYLTSANEEDIVRHLAILAETLRHHAPAGLRRSYDPRPDLRHDNIYRSVSPQTLHDLYPT